MRDGAVEQVPAALAATLSPEGRLVTGVIRNGVTRLELGRRSGDGVSLISVTEAQKEAMRKFCALQARRKVPFSRMAMMRAVTPFPRATDGRTWFCSELCVAAMQAGGLLLDEVAAACTPSDVHELLLSLRAYSSASPVVEDRIAANKLRCGSKWFRRAGAGGGR